MAIATFQPHPLRKACAVFGLAVVICLAQVLIFAPYIWPLPVSWGDIDIKQVAHCFESMTLMTPAAFQIRRLPEVCTITGLSRTTILEESSHRHVPEAHDAVGAYTRLGGSGPCKLSGRAPRRGRPA
jgi:hypothetical protein